MAKVPMGKLMRTCECFAPGWTFGWHEKPPISLRVHSSKAGATNKPNLDAQRFSEIVNANRLVSRNGGAPTNFDSASQSDPRKFYTRHTLVAEFPHRAQNSQKPIEISLLQLRKLARGQFHHGIALCRIV